MVSGMELKPSNMGPGIVEVVGGVKEEKEELDESGSFSLFSCPGRTLVSSEA
jgi:hypothetical protein